MIESTGRMFVSIYTPALSVLPALAIFLHEPTWRIVIYTIIISFYFFVNTFSAKSYGLDHNYNTDETRKFGVAIISILSLIMSVIIGAITK